MKLIGSLILSLGLVGCAHKDDNTRIQGKPGRNLILSVQDGDGKTLDVLTITPKGELFQGKKQISRPDEIIASFYNMVLIPESTLQKCQKSLAFYRAGQIQNLQKQLVDAEKKAIAKKEAEAAKAKAAAESAKNAKNAKKTEDTKKKPKQP